MNKDTFANTNIEKSLPRKVYEIYEKIISTKKFTHKTIKEFKTKIFELKLEYATNERIYRILENINRNLDDEEKQLNNLKMTIIAALGTIFLPLGFITGYFGMNFRSMGNPSLKTGILAIKNVDRFIASLSFFSITIISILYFINF